jgi:hypothetical protein
MGRRLEGAELEVEVRSGSLQQSVADTTVSTAVSIAW